MIASPEDSQDFRARVGSSLASDRKTTSRYADTFDHDEDAASYDRIVRSEADPLRAESGELLSWVVREAKMGSDSIVVDLGIGTGDASRLNGGCSALIGPSRVFRRRNCRS